MGKKLLSNNEKAMFLALFGGVLMLIAGVSGAAAWNAIGDAVAELTDSDEIALAFAVMVLLGSLGGILVIIGALQFKKRKKVKAGKLLITIGAGFGLIGLIILVILSLVNGDFLFFAGIGIGLLGLILTIMARKRVRG